MRLPFFLFLFLISSTGIFAQSKVVNIAHVSVAGLQNDEIGATDKQILDISISPNPTRDDARLEFVTSKAGKVDIALLNTIGKKIEHFSFTKELISGRHVINLNTSELPQGLYFVEIVSNGARTVQRLFVLAN